MKALPPFGRVLWLAADPELVRAQLAGRDLTHAQAGALRNDISTDEIAPLAAMVHFDATLGRYAHTGFTAGGERPIGVDALRRAGIGVLVAGKRYGKGSSREHPPWAKLAAGIRLVVAESFERIYRDNADNLGLLTSTDLSLPERPRVDIAYGGGCTAGKRADFEAYHEVLAWAAACGLRVAPGVALYLQFGTEDVRRHAEAAGWCETFRAVGATLLPRGCGASANGGPGASTRPQQVTVSAINRNFPGRSGPGQVWLASPATVAASAIAGRLVSFAELAADLKHAAR